MELEEMKSLWEDMSQKVAAQQVVTDKLIIQMTQQKFKNKFSSIWNYEVSGTLICLVFGLLIIFNFDKMNTWYLMACSITALIFLVALPVISLSTLRGIKNINLASLSYKQMFEDFTKRKKRLLFIQQSTVYLSLFMMFITIPVFSMIFNNKDFFKQEYGVGYWIFVGAVAILVLMFARYGYSCYKRKMNSAEELLKEIKES
jgi:hypothetical protein